MVCRFAFNSIYDILKYSLGEFADCSVSFLVCKVAVAFAPGDRENIAIRSHKSECFIQHQDESSLHVTPYELYAL